MDCPADAWSTRAGGDNNGSDPEHHAVRRGPTRSTAPVDAPRLPTRPTSTPAPAPGADRAAISFGQVPRTRSTSTSSRKGVVTSSVATTRSRSCAASSGERHRCVPVQGRSAAGRRGPAVTRDLAGKGFVDDHLHQDVDRGRRSAPRRTDHHRRTNARGRSATRRPGTIGRRATAPTASPARDRLRQDRDRLIPVRTMGPRAGAAGDSTLVRGSVEQRRGARDSAAPVALGA